MWVCYGKLCSAFAMFPCARTRNRCCWNSCKFRFWKLWKLRTKSCLFLWLCSALYTICSDSDAWDKKTRRKMNNLRTGNSLSEGHAEVRCGSINIAYFLCVRWWCILFSRIVSHTCGNIVRRRCEQACKHGRFRFLEDHVPGVPTRAMIADETKNT